jgi:hypothetical protein
MTLVDKKPDGGIYQQDKEPCMGMFDTVTFRYRMLDGETESEYQTKDLDCECAFYEISAEGRLLRWPDDADELNETGLDGPSPYAPVSAITCTLTRGSWNGSKDIPGRPLAV